MGSDSSAPGADSRETPGAASERPQVQGPATESAANPDPSLTLRASDDERHQLVELLGDHVAAGRLSLAEWEERVARAYASTTRGELVALTHDLPAAAAPALAAEPTHPARKPQRTRWFFAIMGGSAWRGRHRLSGRVNSISIMGGDDIDLREVEIEGEELLITCFSLMGGATIYVPDTIDVEMSGPAIMGGNDERGSTRAPRPGAPLIRIRSIAIMGGVTLWRLPAESRGRSLKEARRAAKQLERGRG